MLGVVRLAGVDLGDTYPGAPAVEEKRHACCRALPAQILEAADVDWHIHARSDDPIQLLRATQPAGEVDRLGGRAHERPAQRCWATKEPRQPRFSLRLGGDVRQHANVRRHLFGEGSSQGGGVGRYEQEALVPRGAAAQDREQLGLRGGIQAGRVLGDDPPRARPAADAAGDLGVKCAACEQGKRHVGREVDRRDLVGCRLRRVHAAPRFSPSTFHRIRTFPSLHAGQLSQTNVDDLQQRPEKRLDKRLWLA